MKIRQINALANTHSPVAKRCPGDSQEGAGEDFCLLSYCRTACAWGKKKE